jgi:hypothetical protein
MVVTHRNSTQAKWQVENCIDFRKLNVAIKKDPYPLFFTMKC